MNGLGYHPEPSPGFIPLLLAAFLVGAMVNITIPLPEPTEYCTWYHYPTGWDSMKHWRECYE